MISPCPETEYTSLHSRLVYFFLGSLRKEARQQPRPVAGCFRGVSLLLALSLPGPSARWTDRVSPTESTSRSAGDFCVERRELRCLSKIPSSRPPSPQLPWPRPHFLDDLVADILFRTRLQGIEKHQRHAPNLIFNGALCAPYTWTAKRPPG